MPQPLRIFFSFFQILLFSVAAIHVNLLTEHQSFAFFLERAQLILIKYLLLKQLVALLLKLLGGDVLADDLVGSVRDDSAAEVVRPIVNFQNVAIG